MSTTAITVETRRASFTDKKPTIAKSQAIVLEYLNRYNYSTANELAKYMQLQGIYPYFNRNFTHPRLNELVEKGLVAVADVRKCTITGKTCAVYKVKGEKECCG